VSVALLESADGLTIIQTVSAGYRGLGSMLDIATRRYLSSRFACQMAEHGYTEFNRLRDMLRRVSATCQARQTQ
jgi:hypothetical protein